MKYLLILFWLIPSQIREDIVTPVDNLGCLTANIYYEARNQGVKGMQLVRDVTLNRSLKLNNNVCNIVFAKKQFSWTFQQPWQSVQNRLKGSTSDLNTKEVLAYQQAYKIASEGLLSGSRAIPEGVLFYHTTKVNPVWNRKMKVYSTIGDHVAYYGDIK